MHTVRYKQVNAMLLNEFLKARRKMQEQQATSAKQQKQIDAFPTGFQKSERTPRRSESVRWRT